ncbi:MAG TPA: ferritin-like domain-containing protein [Thermoleophilaceae bacterium]|nr:ferritin-like domain-containing protein [Thermoleophilaceae bacterium]
MPGPITRRRALGGAAVLLASCGSSDSPSSSGPRPGAGVGVLNSLLALEHTAVAAYGAGAPLLRGQALRYARQIEEQERGHVRRLEELIRGLGGTAARSRTPDEYARSFPRLRNRDDALRFAEDVEERLVRYYLQALRRLPDSRLRRAAAEICADEGAHLGVLHLMRGGPAAPQPFVTGTL